MLIKIKEVIKHTSFYALGNISIKLVGFILLPLYTKEISVADYGVWGLFEITEMLMTPILLIGLPHALLRWHGLAKSGGGEKNLFTVFIFLLVVCVVFLALAMLGRALFSNFLFGNSSYENYFIPLFLAIVFSVLSRVPLTLLRSEEKSFLFSVSVVTRFTISLVLNIYFIAILKLGVLGILIAHAISSGIVFVLLLPYLFRKMQPSFEIHELKKMIAFGYPFIFSAIAAAVLAMGDRYLISKFSTFSDVGLYTLGQKFSNVLSLFLVESFSLGFPVIGWKMVKEENQPQRFFTKTLTYFVFVLLWFGLVLSAYSKGIIHRFALNPDYWDAYKVIPLLTLAIVFVGMERVFFFLLQIPKKTNYIAFIIAGAALLNIVLNMVLLPLYGIMGAAVAKVLAHICAAIYAYRMLQNAYPVKFEIKRIFVLFAAGIGLYFLTMLFNDFPLFERIIYKGILILSYPFLLYFVNFYEPIELNRIHGSIKKWSKKIRFLIVK